MRESHEQQSVYFPPVSQMQISWQKVSYTVKMGDGISQHPPVYQLGNMIENQSLSDLGERVLFEEEYLRGCFLLRIVHRHQKQQSVGNGFPRDYEHQ